MTHFSSPIDYLHALDRYQFLTILNAANECEEYQFAKQAAMLWLVNYPGDLYVQYFQALTYQHLGINNQALASFEGLIEQDPFFVEPVQAMVQLSESLDKIAYYKSLVQFLTQENPSNQEQAKWLSPLWEARRAFSQEDFTKTNTLIHQSLINDPPSSIPAILHLKTAYKMENQEMLNNLSEIYYQKWPKCLQVNIIKALAEMDQGQESSAVERLHWVAAHDSAGQVIVRLMGSKHRFQNLWTDHLEVYFDIPIPASISSRMGWNQLTTGQISPPDFKGVGSSAETKNVSNDESTQEINIADNAIAEDEPIQESSAENLYPEVPAQQYATTEDFAEIQQSFSKLAKRLKKPDLDRADNRFPVYVILSSKKQLQSLYGPNTAAIIDDLLKNMVSLIQKLPEWSALLFYPDDPAQMSQFGLKPMVATDAWQVKLSLFDLDETLARQGEMVGSLLIVGGPQIIPFHHLPNPTHDSDLDVPSDNPYSTIDENYFIPQWPVGRLPGESGADAGLLLSQIRQLIYQYQKKSKQIKTGPFNLGSLINWMLTLFTNIGQNVNHKLNLGYSAEIWQEASQGVYKTIGRAKDLQLSPPTHSGNLILNNGNGHNIGYFNLHGIKDGPHWYGQKNFSSESNGPDYPIALSPGMVNENTPSPKLVFTEACYGAYVDNKHHEEALSLKFLDSGTKSFIGSTCIAYGSVTMPLIAADFLAEMFWQQVMDGHPAGYALMQAKLNLAEKMTRLQGFLDGEDQKTILSFVLYGDPLAVHDNLMSMPKPLFRMKTHPAVRTISDSDMETTFDHKKMPKNVDKQVKKIIEEYLPGLHNAQMKVNKTGSEQNEKFGRQIDPDRYVVTLQKSFGQNELIVHQHFARMTFDKKGKLVKFSTSR